MAIGEGEWRTRASSALQAFHEDEQGIATTEYIIVFSLVSFGATLALLGVAAYVKGYRDFLLWWLAHPAV